MQQAKAMMTWAWSERPIETGLDEVEHEWWHRRLAIPFKSKPRTHPPTIDELVRTLFVAEWYSSSRRPDQAITPGTLEVLWGVVLTAQRTGALVVLRRDRLFEHPERPDGKVANWLAAEVKNRGKIRFPHSLPLPSAALEILERYSDLAGPRTGCFRVPRLTATSRSRP